MPPNPLTPAFRCCVLLQMAAVTSSTACAPITSHTSAAGGGGGSLPELPPERPAHTSLLAEKLHGFTEKLHALSHRGGDSSEARGRAGTHSHPSFHVLSLLQHFTPLALGRLI